MVDASQGQLSELRQLCAKYWNPIGVVMDFEPEAQNDPSPMPADEYDSYLMVAWQMINKGATEDDVVSYLSQVETEFIGLSRPAGNKLAFVEAIFAVFSHEIK